MNLEQKIMEKLNAIRRTETLKTDKDSGYVIEEEIDSMRLRAEIQDFDKFSYMVKTLTVTQTPTPNAPVKALLLQQANEIERRISYLLESFRLVELDEINGLAQVRSVSPFKKNDETVYYEALLQHGNSVTFTRYRKQRHTEKREVIPSHLTQETFERLINDLAAIVRINVS